MTFQYYGGGTPPLRGLDYGREEVQQPAQQAQINPSALMKMFGQGGATPLGSGATAAGSAGPGGASALSQVGIAGQGVGGSGSGAGSGMAAAGPWAALAAVIVGNELYARKRGYRSEDKGEYMKDLFSGEVFHQDIEQRFLPKLGIDEGSKTSKAISFLLNPSPVNFGEQWDRLKDIF